VSGLACVASVLQCVAQCVAECGIVAECEISVAQVLLRFSVGSFIRRLRVGSVAVCFIVLQCVAVCCSVLQCVAVCCSVVGIVAVCFIVLQYAVVWRSAFLR